MDVRLVHRHDAAELVKIRYNFASVPPPIRIQPFRSFTGDAGTFAHAAELRGDGDHVSTENFSRANVSAREPARYNIL
jgi:hypothetical protein